MATYKEKDGKHTIEADGSEDVQVVTMTREEARAYFDDGSLPEGFDTAMDLAQSEAESGRAVVIVVIEQSAA